MIFIFYLIYLFLVTFVKNFLILLTFVEDYAELKL